MPKPPTLTVRQPDLDGHTVTVTYFSRCTWVYLGPSTGSLKYDRCEDCRWNYTWHGLNQPAVCYDCAPFRAYAALPWWRRWTSRKPRP